jgi:integrase/recombinase XerD
MTTVGSLVYQFFEHHLKAEKGLSQASIRSYRDGIRLFLLFLAKTTHRPISKLALSDLGAHNVRDFLAHLEAERGNTIRSRNHRLAMLHTFFAYVGAQTPELLREAERVAAIPTKRTQPPATRYLERDEVEFLFANMPRKGRLAVRDRALLLLLYNTGARGRTRRLDHRSVSAGSALTRQFTWQRQQVADLSSMAGDRADAG